MNVKGEEKVDAGRYGVVTLHSGRMAGICRLDTDTCP